MVGVMVGSTNWQSSSSTTTSTNPMDTARATTARHTAGDNDNGWQTLHVYYGSTDQKEKTLLPSGRRFFSQARQDECVLSLLRNRTGGYFVDLAANDATILSNTYALERHYGWNGLCIEPNPTYWYNLSHYRPHCTLVAGVLGQRTGDTMDFLYTGNEHGGIVGEGFDNARSSLKKDSLQERTVTLRDVFRKFNVPSVIDYMSLDVEGAEEFVLRHFPFQEYTIRLLTIERPKEGLRQILENNGYTQKLRLSRWGETLWVQSSLESSLDLTHLEDFHGKKQWEEQKKRERAAQEENAGESSR